MQQEFSRPAGAALAWVDELARAIREGLEARRLFDDDTAEARFGRAVQLAHQSGSQETARLLAMVVDVIDPATGMVWLKHDRPGPDDA